MTKFKLKLHCPEKLSIKNFVQFIKQSNFNLNINSNDWPTKKSVVTFLKSSHVNKSAQRQVEYKVFRKSITIETSNPFKTYLFLKKINECLFFDVTFVSLNILFTKKQTLFFESLKKNSTIKKKLKILDIAGEKILVTYFIFWRF